MLAAIALVLDHSICFLFSPSASVAPIKVAPVGASFERRARRSRHQPSGVSIMKLGIHTSVQIAPHSISSCITLEFSRRRNWSAGMSG